MITRPNRIESFRKLDTGTGIYLGNYDGDDELARGPTEFSVLADTIGTTLRPNTRMHATPACPPTARR